jgi:hypothetical protein
VTKASLVITAEDKATTYGAPFPPFTAVYDGFVNGDSPAKLNPPLSLTTKASVRSGVGDYPITPVGGGNPNYDIVLQPGTLKVNPASLTVTAENKTKTYGAPLPAFTASFSGFLNGDTAAVLTAPVAFSTTATERSAVGTYPITPSGAASPNYTLSFKPGALTVSRALLTVTAEPKTKSYGGPSPELTATYSGFVNGDTAANLAQPVLLSTTATASSPVGTYQIRVAGGESPNYTLAYNNGVLSVVKAPLIICADDQTVPVGGPIPRLTATYKGLVNNDTAASLITPVTITTTASAASPAGSYPITVSGARSLNYAIAFLSGTLTIGTPKVAPKFDSRDARLQADGSLKMNLAVPSGVQVRLEWSDDLRTWSELGTQTAAAERVQFTVPGIAKSRRGFFRAIVLPSQAQSAVP